MISKEFITRQFIRDNPDTIFVFGDNLTGKGYGGQAKEARGQPNAIGVPTKKKPSNDINSFFCDGQFFLNIRYIDESIDAIREQVARGKKLHIMRGIGTGLSKMNIYAPKTYEYMVGQLYNLINYIESDNPICMNCGQCKLDIVRTDYPVIDQFYICPLCGSTFNKI